MTNTNQPSDTTEATSTKRTELRDKSARIMSVAFGDHYAEVVSAGAPKATITIRKAAKDQLATSAINADLARAHGVETCDDLREVINVDGLMLPSGSGVYMGPANVGKSPVLKYIIDKAGLAGRLIRFGEPLPGYITDEDVAASVLAKALLDPEVKIIAIDSIKDLLATMGGGLMARGIPRPVFRLLSQWGTLASTLGKLILVPLNISTDDPNAVQEVSAAVLSNTTTALIAQADRTVTFTSRTGEGKIRREGRFTVQYGDKTGVEKLVLSRGALEQRSKGVEAKFQVGNESIDSTLVSASIFRALSMTKH